MKRLYRLIFGVLLLGATITLGVAFLHHANVQVLNPKGVIAAKERRLIIIAVLLSTIVVVPVFVMTALFAWRYREGNTEAVYTPNWDHSHRLEAIWWLVPTALIFVLSVITWKSTHELDPTRSLASATNPAMTIQVVALDWKWLFIYPDSGVATVNYVELPQNKPVHFELTSDAPMNSFWVPQLGGQIYAMSGMSTQLNLMGTSVGDYRGSSANISGNGFAGMVFTARVRNQADYDHWLTGAQTSPNQLSQLAYDRLTQPSSDVVPATYAAPAPGLYDTIMAKVMAPMDMSGMEMK